MERKTEFKRQLVVKNLSALALFGFLALFTPAVRAAEPSFYVTPYNDDILSETIQNRIKFGDIADKFCGDPTVEGYAGLFEDPLNIPYRNSLGKVAYLKETDPESDHQVHKVCIVDLVDKKDNHTRDRHSIADVDWKTFNQISPNKNLDITFISPEETKPITTTIPLYNSTNETTVPDTEFNPLPHLSR